MYFLLKMGIFQPAMLFFPEGRSYIYIIDTLPETNNQSTQKFQWLEDFDLTFGKKWYIFSGTTVSFNPNLPPLCKRLKRVIPPRCLIHGQDDLLTT